MDSSQWPPQCCAVAFFSKARESLNLSPLAPQHIARGLDVRVSPNDDNPWDLRVEENRKLQGTRPSELHTKWRDVFGDAQAFSFRYIPFNTVSFEMYWDLANAALVAGLVVGLGFDYSCISGGEAASHVCRIESVVPTSGTAFRISLVDDSQNGLRLTVESEALQQAVRAVEGGFWLLGDPSLMHLPYALPWTA